MIKIAGNGAGNEAGTVASSHNIHCIAERLRPYVRSGMRTDFVLVGGAALWVYGLRDYMDDVDVYTSSEEVYMQWLTHGDKDESVDMTSSQCMFGQIKIADCEKSRLIFDGLGMRIRLLDPSTLFIQKADSARERDIQDLEALKTLIPDPMDILRRIKEVRHGNHYGSWYLVTENLLAEIQAQYMIPITHEMIAATGMDEDDMRMLAEAFGLAGDPDLNDGDHQAENPAETYRTKNVPA